MAYKLDKEQLNGTANGSGARSEVHDDKNQYVEAIAHNSQEEFEPAATTSKEHNGQLEKAIAPQSSEQDEFEQDFYPDTKEPKKRRWLLPMLMGMGFGVVLAVGGTQLLSNKKAQPDPAAKAEKSQLSPSLTVTVAPAETTTVSRTLDANGSVAAYDLLKVLPQATGVQIKQVLADEGDAVKVGQVLAVLDNSVIQTQIQQAKAQLESSQAVVGQKQAGLAQARATLAQAQRELERYQSLANQGAISRQELETRRTTVITNQESVGVARANIASAQADVKNNQAKIQQIQTQLEQTIVRAPASGIVAERNARVGDVSTGFQSQPLFTIIREGYLELQLKVPETQLSEVRVGATVTITSNTDSRLRLQGKVREISPLIDQTTRQATVKIELPSFSYKESASLRPGMFLRGAIVSNTAQALTVPASAVLPQSEGKGIVYLLNNDNTVKAQTVEVGETTNSTQGEVKKSAPTSGGELSNARIEIKSGLKIGDRVVVDGAGYLKDGDVVKVVQR